MALLLFKEYGTKDKLRTRFYNKNKFMLPNIFKVDGLLKYFRTCFFYNLRTRFFFIKKSMLI